MGFIGVSICIFSYNYEKYIALAIQSVLNQRTSFPIEIIIGDDCSTDGTRQIAESYQDMYPDIIHLSFNGTNIGGTNNWIKTMNQCKGKYIALLDGDDYFTDKHKLQKQYDCLEFDNNAVLCFHAVEEKYDNIEGKDTIMRFDKRKYTSVDFATGWFIRTSTAFFRSRILLKDTPEWVHLFPYRYDTILYVFLSQFGYALYLDEPMSVWRKHFKGMSRFLMSNAVKNLQSELALAQKLNEYTSFQHSSKVNKYSTNLYADLFVALLRTGVFIKKLPLLLECLKKMNYLNIVQKMTNKLWK